MQNSIIPHEQMEYLTESYLPKVSVKSQIIYTTIILAMTILAFSLPFILIDVSIQANGIIRPISEKAEISSFVSGTIDEIYVRENDVVIKNQLLLRVSNKELLNEVALVDFKLTGLNAKMKDLKMLKSINTENIFRNINLNTSYYAQQLNMLRSLAQENIFAQNKVKEELKSDERLYKDNIISKRELNEKQYELDRLKAEYSSLFQKYRSQWQAELTENMDNYKQYSLDNDRKEMQLEFYEIKSPIDGTVQQIKAKYKGSIVQAGEEFLTITPNDDLIAECYLSPKDIGLLKEKMQVNFQIDAFNYNEWGFLPGEVFDISKDYIILNEIPVFKVKCKLYKTTLSLKTGFTAEIKKGMTLRGRFIVARRSLFQLLYDNIDDWLNPKTLMKQNSLK